MDQDKVQMIVDWPPLTDLHQLQSFTGLTLYYRRFVEGYAEVDQPLHQLTNKGISLSEWKRETAFQTLKRVLTQPDWHTSSQIVDTIILMQMPVGVQ